MKEKNVKRESVTINGDRWTVVDVAPAEALAEMVATILEDEGFIVMTRGAAGLSDVLTHLGGYGAETSYVLVPEGQAEAALALIAETVTDFEGEELERFLAEQAAEGAAEGTEADREGREDELER